MNKSKDGIKCSSCGKAYERPEGDVTEITCDECGHKIAIPAKKSDRVTMDRISWLLNGDTPEEQEMLGLSRKFTKNRDGFLEGRAVVTNVGVFDYVQPDGSVIRELRPPEEVFHPDSIASLRLKPLTNDHPSEAVTPENVKAYQVGSLGDSIECDAYRIWAPIVITEENAIKVVHEDGKRALSCGYTCDLEMKSGVWMGVQYDAIQRNIRYNHVAICDQGRAGDEATMRIDAHKRQVGIQIPNKKEHSMLVKLKLDGAEYEAHPKVLEALEQANAKADAKSIELSQLSAKCDSAMERSEALEAEVTALKQELGASVKADSIDGIVASRIALMETARKAGVEVKADSTEADLKRGVILAVFPKANLDGRDEAYISARFDSATEELQAREEEESVKGQGDVVVDKPNGTQEEQKVDSAEAFKRNAMAQQEAWKR